MTGIYHTNIIQQQSAHFYAYQLAFNQLDTMLITLDLNGKITDINEKILAFTATSWTEQIGHLAWESTTLDYFIDSRQDLKTAIYIARHGKSIKLATTDTLSASGELHRLQLSITPVTDYDKIIKLLLLEISTVH
jgi:PAS domain S-box-containing protein